MNKENKNLITYPNGLLNGLGSHLDITSATTEQWKAETDSGRYINVKLAFYVFDGNTASGKKIANAKTGNEIQSAMEGMLEPTEEENIVGNLEVRETYKISKVGFNIFHPDNIFTTIASSFSHR